MSQGTADAEVTVGMEVLPGMGHKPSPSWPGCGRHHRPWLQDVEECGQSIDMDKMKL